MKLGNSNGNNKGKKYLRKSEVDLVYAFKADEFNTWMTDNYLKVMQFLKEKNIYEADVFSDTYEKIYEKIFYSDMIGNDYRGYFQRAYYTNYINSRVQNNRYIELWENYDKDDVDSEYFAEMEAKQTKLENDIMEYIYLNYSIREYEIFRMYINLKPAINYHSLAEITGMKYHHIQSIVAKIKSDVQRNKAFSMRRNELA